MPFPSVDNPNLPIGQNTVIVLSIALVLAILLSLVLIGILIFVTRKKQEEASKNAGRHQSFNEMQGKNFT